MKKQAGLLSLQTDFKAESGAGAHLQFDFIQAETKTFDPVFQNNFFLYRDSLANVAKGLDWQPPPEITFDTYITGPGEIIFDWFFFNRPGNLISDYSKSGEDRWAISGSLSQEIRNHNFTLGGQFERETIREFRLGSTLFFAKTLREEGFELGEPVELTESQSHLLRDRGPVLNFGYDIFGRDIESTDNVNDGAKHPNHLSLYLQDTFRHNKLNTTFGFRFDRFSSDASVFKTPNDPQILGRNLSPAILKRAPAHTFLSPRVNFAYYHNYRWSFGFDFGNMFNRFV